VKFALIDVEKTNFPIGFMCDELGVSRSGYYAWRERRPSKRSQKDEELLEDITESHRLSRRKYGSPRVFKDLQALGRRTSRKRIARLMRDHGLVARTKKRFKRTTDSKHSFPIAENLLGRAFDVDAPNLVWVTDITYVWTKEGWLYLAAIVDLYARVVVGWAMSERIDTALCLDALEMAMTARRPRAGLIHHSDRGSQYASHEYRRALERHGARCSMSRKGDCWDNAVAESFWSTLKMELIYDEDFETRAETRQAIFEYIEVFYNRRRRHSSIGYRFPVEHEQLYRSAAQAA